MVVLKRKEGPGDAAGRVEVEDWNNAENAKGLEFCTESSSSSADCGGTSGVVYVNWGKCSFCGFGPKTH